MTETLVLPARPYKFLDAYTPEDAPIFFGRGRETRVLVTDVMVNRLVVLFARTGTGKTSLINAAARPRLEEQGYTTFFIRVHEDPVASARAELAAHASVSKLGTGSLADQLERIVRKLKRPIVLFFDQFEEFFIYVQRPKPEKAREFISDVARLYRNRESGVHFVFSMREEFFVEMDAFRDEIPTIFHNESNLRLRRLDRQEAYEAIVHPARVFDVRLDADLVEQMLDDLATAADAGGAVEPAQLQIVADALWDERADGRLTLAHYHSLGRQGSKDNIAQQILYGRLQEAFSKLESRRQLDLLERLLGELRTKLGTKWVRDVEGLTQLLTSGTDVTCEDVRALLRLLEGVRFIRRGTRDKLEVIELSHDYLVDRIDELQRRVRLIWPRRLLADATPELLPSRADLNDIAAVADRLDINSHQGELLFAASVSQSVQPEFWFAIARAAGADPTSMLHEWTLHHTAPPLMSQISIGVIERLLLSNEVPADKERLRTILELALDRDPITIDAQDSLVRLAHTAERTLADAAQQRLLTLVHDRIAAGRIAPGVLAWLSTDKRPGVVPLLRQFLDRYDLTFDAQAALLTVIVSGEWHRADIDEARKILLAWIENKLGTSIEQIAPETIRSLGRIEDQRAVDVLARALRHGVFAADAKTALERATASDIPEVARSARRVLAVGLEDGVVPSDADIPADEERVARKSFESYADHDMERIAQMIVDGRCVVILGAGIHAPSPTGRPTFATYEERALLTRDVTLKIAQISAYEGKDINDFRRVMQFAETRLDRPALVSEIAKAIGSAREPSPLLGLLAELPVRLWVTTNYDVMLERALKKAGKSPFVVRVGREEPIDITSVRFSSPTVMKLHGDITEPSSLVITEDDFIDFVLQSAAGLPPQLIGAVATGCVLLLGWNYRSVENRFILRLLLPTNRWETAIFAIDPAPDRLLRTWQRAHALRVIEDDLWSFIPRLHQVVWNLGSR